MGEELQAWQTALERLGVLGAAIEAPPFPVDEAGVLEGFEHLVDQAVVWLAWETLHADPSRPFFHRHNDLTSQWGGPNADNVYRHARIESGRRYRVRGRMHSCDEFLLAVRAGFMHQTVWGTLQTVVASELGVGPGDDFELLFGGDEVGAIELPEGSVMISVREYYFDWTVDEPAVLTIECLDPEPRAPLTSEAFVGRLDASMSEIEASVSYWNDYLNDNRSARTDNTFLRNDASANTVKVGKGLSIARYEFCFWDLAPDECLIVTADEPEARYWAAQLYTMGSFELVDPYGSITSRNHRQLYRDTGRSSDDRTLRFVLSHTDPGVANWLDIGERQNGLCTFRWFWPTSDASPEIRTEVVKTADVLDNLPAGIATLTPAQRAAELAERQAHLRWRFRT